MGGSKADRTGIYVIALLDMGFALALVAIGYGAKHATERQLLMAASHAGISYSVMHGMWSSDHRWSHLPSKQSASVQPRLQERHVRS